jgi:hypothetical protein
MGEKQVQRTLTRLVALPNNVPALGPNFVREVPRITQR